MEEQEVQPLKAGDRVRMGIAPDLVGVITEALEDGMVMFQADGQTDAHEFHPDSFVRA